MRRWVVPVLAVLVAVAAASPAPLRVKRADETVMFGNQQNLAHKSVKKSGPAPPDSKLAAKQVTDDNEDDPAAQLSRVAGPEDDPEGDLHTLQSHGPAEANAPVIIEEKKPTTVQPQLADKKKKKKKKSVDVNLGEKPKRTKKEYEDLDLRARYMDLLNKLDPDVFAYARQAAPGRREKRSAAVTAAKLGRLRRDLTRLASESNMASSAQHRKRREAAYDPRSLAMLEYMLDAAGDGYELPEDVVEPAYAEERPEEFELQRRDAPMELPEEFALAKRVPDLEEAGPAPTDLQAFLPPAEGPSEEEEVPLEEEEEEEEAPVSVYESEYGPVRYGLVEHEGVPGLFVPLEQRSMRRLLAAERSDREDERERLRALATILSLNQEQRK